MFGSCDNLESIDLFYNTQNVKDMDSLFYYCYSLLSIDLSRFDTSSVIRMDYMFYSCSKLTSIDLSNFNVEKVYTLSRMFALCNNLQYLDFSPFKGSYHYYYHLFYVESNISCTIKINKNLGTDIINEIPSHWIKA